MHGELQDLRKLQDGWIGSLLNTILGIQENMYEELMRVKHAGETAVLHPIAWSLHYRRSTSEPSSDDWIFLVSAQDPDIVEMLENEAVPVPDGTEDFEEVDEAPQETRWWKFMSQQWSKKRPFTKAELDFMTGAEKVKLAPCQRCEAISRDCIPQGIGKRCANCVRTRRACTYVAKGRFLADPSTYWDILLRNAERPIPVLPAVPYLYPLHKVDQTGIDHGELIKKLRRPITCEDAERPLEEAELLGLASIGDNMGSEVEEVSEATLASPVQVSRVIVPYNEPVPEDITRAIAAMKDLYQKETAVLQGGPGSGLAGAIQSLVTEFATPSALGFLS
ncbi:hypothetical protein DENSPDRAFT_877201 [Dentipellis sp. KUC8613]|nr:hypothetical protein DENSPDRAFT_877201 [Dentipellis sp. KUC8613]